jgi:hypothetical protein
MYLLPLSCHGEKPKARLSILLTMPILSATPLAVQLVICACRRGIVVTIREIGILSEEHKVTNKNEIILRPETGLCRVHRICCNDT